MERRNKNLFDAIENNNIQSAKYFIKKGSNVNEVKDGKTPIMLAIEQNNVEMTELLFDKGADIKMNNLLVESFKKNNIKMTKLALSRGANVNSKTHDGITMLLLALHKNVNIEIIKLLLDWRADVNGKTSKGTTALIYATRSVRIGGMERVKLLLERGADINKQDDYGYSALMASVLQSNTTSSLEVIEYLLSHGANVNQVNNQGRSSVMIAAKYVNTTSNLETVKLLIGYGANIFDINKEETVVDKCATQECKDLVLKYIWEQLYSRDLITAARYSRETTIPKDVWEIILLNKRQQLLCSKLGSDKNKEVLKLFALELNIPIDENMTKGQLCGAISRQLVYGKIYNKTDKEREVLRKQFLEVAKKYNINTNQSMEEIIKDISRVFY